MNTYTITIGALSLITVGFGTLFRFKYKTLKQYYELKTERYDNLYKHYSETQKVLKDVLADNNRKSEKVKKKDEQIYNQSLMIKDLEQELNDLILTHSIASKEITKLNNILTYFQTKMQGNKQFEKLVKDFKGGEE
jgi:galactokinase/mevalonate kinase-like predicted kinase